SAKGPFFKLRPINKPPLELSSSYYLLRSRTIYLFDALLTERVFLPSVGLPQGDTGDGRPIGVRPSPPPCGCSTGFIAEPRTVGLTPFQRVRPAFPTRTNSCSMFPTCPTVARQVDNTKRTSPELKRTNVYFPSRPRICAPAPAERTNCPPAPGFNSTL